MKGRSRLTPFSLLCLLIAGIGLVVSGPAQAFVEDCPTQLQRRLDQAKDYLTAMQETLADDFDVDARPGQDRRAQRQIMRKVEKLSFICKSSEDCTTHTAVQGTVVFGNRIRICAPHIVRAPFCYIVSVVAHEFGHNAHIPRDRMGAHNRMSHNNPDRVYQFGYFAEDLCSEDILPFNADDETADPQPTPLVIRRNGIVLFPHANFTGRPRQFLLTQSAEIGYGKYLSGNPESDAFILQFRRYFDDLRFIGRNDAFSSARVYNGFWELCDQARNQGPCIYLDADTADFAQLGFDDKVSSLRYVAANRPTSGIYLFSARDFRGGGKYFPAGVNRIPGDSPTGGRTNAAEVDVHIPDGVSSVRVVAGSYEGCEELGRQGWCHYLRGDVADLGTFGADNALRSFWPVTEDLREALTFYKETNLRGAHHTLSPLAEHSTFGGTSHRLNREIKSLNARGTWQVCTQPQFRGTCRMVSGEVRDVAALGLGAAIMSARRQGGAAGFATLFAMPSFAGASHDLFSSERNLAAVGFDNSTHSIRIADDRLYVLCEETEYRGFCRYLGRGEAGNAGALGGLAGLVSSINIQPDHSTTRESKLILMHEPSGGERHLTGSIANLATLAVGGRATAAYIKNGAWEFCLQPQFGDCRLVAQAGLVRFADLGMRHGPHSLRLREDVAFQAPPGDLPSLPPAGAGACEAAIRNIERGPGGGRNWPAEELRRLCAGAETSYQPSYCINVVLNRNTSWGGGTVWQISNAIDLCEGTTNAGQTLDCFNRAIAANVGWQSAIGRCQTR